MSLLGPIGSQVFMYCAIAAAALAIGAYIIKMRRRRFEVPFSALWRRVLEQKDANSLWKQLKRLLSLLLILVILGIILFAAMDPTLGAVDREARSVVVLLDASGSMKTMDGDDTGKLARIDAAKKATKKLIDSMGGGDIAMIMKVDGQATPMSRFSNDGPMLDKIVDGIQASDTPADLTRALGAAADALRDRPNPLIVLVSDGAFPEAQLNLVNWDKNKKDLAAVDLSGVDVRFVPVGKRHDNVGIVAFNVRRYIANKAAYEVYIEIQNFGPDPAHRQLKLYNGDNPVDQRKIDLGPAGTPTAKLRQIYSKIPSTGDNKLHAAIAPLEGPGGSDAFTLDDTAYALLPARKKQKVLMVTEDNLFLEAALLVYENVDPLKVTPKEYDDKPSVADGMDVVIFDEHTPAVLPPSPTSLMFFHPSGESSPFKIAHEIADPHITEVDKDHPVMQWVSLSDVHMDKSDAFTIDSKRGDSALAMYTNDAVVAARRDGKRKVLAFGFSLPSAGRDAGTDLPMRVAFPMLLVNALDWFAGDNSDLLTTYSTGKRERIPLDGVVGAADAEVKDKDGVVTKTPIIDGLATFYGSKVGYYDVVARGADGKPMASLELAANLSSPEESDIAPSAQLTLGGHKLDAPQAFAVTHSQKIWIYLVLLAALLIVVEWITYHRRITV